ncbi:hypothetical protein GCM10023232_27240 [Sphingosinicella ginsenosidimutans]|uniref:Lipoprotein n=1 Tax=Allosphingosinicella ginsenosidimutans TaxID=1176539 RepID=A0A5C6TTC8_9SPHN|nr:hypothetical protein [Sphingosinicella ginsenosidimutans]TXC63674.1 hypothetical protein FRZ32_08385 [Sphingosinicella ginsenosidimutans]
MRLAILMAGLILAGCGSQANLERQFDIAMNTGTYSDVCTAAGRVADEALQSGDQSTFERWRLTRDIYCSSAARDPMGRPSMRDEENAQAINAARETYRELQHSDVPGVANTARELEQQLNEAERD